MMFGKLMLFVLILLVLVLATTVKSMGLTEGFLTFQKSVDEFTDVRVNAYNNKRNITKFYDETYYDAKNGNVIGVYGTQYGGTGSDDTTGGTVSKIDIVPRDNKSNIITYSKGTTDQALSQESDESKKNKKTPRMRRLKYIIYFLKSFPLQKQLFQLSCFRRFHFSG